MTCFSSADILLPCGVEMDKWAVIACDQFSSEPEYWQRVERSVGDAPSTLRLIFPEALLKDDAAARIRSINAAMRGYEEAGLFSCCTDSFVYVERTLSDGTLRRGLVGVLDLECYEFTENSSAPVRATERTVVERIPPRVAIREGATLELPHVLLLCDDEEDAILAPIKGERLYDFELMEGGGHIHGTLLRGAAAEKMRRRIAAYEQRQRLLCESQGFAPLLYAVGDGNHSLATAKACFERIKHERGAEAAASHPARYALVELENLHDSAQRFAPIHRLVTGTDVPALLKALEEKLGASSGVVVPWISAEASGALTLDTASGRLPVDLLQSFLDDWLASHRGELDYIHGDESLRRLAKAPESVGFLLPEIGKADFFRGIMAGGVLPRKTFSMGQARDKRYYLEARRIV